MIRIDIPNVIDETIPETDLETIQTIKEHIFSVLRLTYYHDVSLFPRPLWTFIEQGKEPSFHISLEMIFNPDALPNTDNVRNAVFKTFPIRVQMKLLSDSQDRRLPLQYRYLSLYKLLELEFKKKKKWMKKELGEFIDKYQKEFENLGKKGNLTNYIHKLRDRCSHITTGKDVLGVTQLSNEDMIEISRFFPLMTKICVHMINEKYQDKDFSLVDYKTFSKKHMK